MRPSVTHHPYKEIPSRLIRSGPFTEVPTTPNQLRWNPVPLPEEPTDFVDGILTLGGNGDPAMLAGVAIHLYAANRSMTDRFFLLRRRRVSCGSADGLASIAHRAWQAAGCAGGDLRASARCEVSCGADRRSGPRRYICENYGLPFRLPELGAIGANGLANARDFKAPVAAL